MCSSDLIALKELKLISGSSNFNISGKAYDWRESILNKDALTANLDIQSDSLNITQVLAAFSPGEKNETENKNGESKDYNENISTTTPGLIQIPKSFNMMINLDAKNLIYDKAEVNSVKGNLLFSNGAFFMHDITLKSGLGNIELSATYAPYSKLQGYTVLNLNIDNLNVEKVIELDDRIIKILPMLSTLQGFVSCNLNLTLELDSMYSPYPGSINATTTIKGNDLSVEKNKVLPKWVGKLLLGKRKRIEIDSISVDVDMYNDVLNIYPFIANIDQYKFYILGYQDVDDSFFYHVSLLKWFLPFKLGFNIYGVPDHMHLRLAKAKIINPDMPAKVISNKNGDVIRPLRINQILQQESQRQQNIYKDFSNQYYNIINQDSLRYSSEERDRIINQLNKTLNETSK